MLTYGEVIDGDARAATRSRYADLLIGVCRADVNRMLAR
jgi:hypothetical protein